MARHWRIATATRRADTKTRREQFVRGDALEVASHVREALERDRVVSVTIRPVNEATYIRKTRSD